ncbi:metal ABC transporter substrate-binding protein [Schaalia suimastitidis]|uniref:metal ABC transporter substrate-binding protein n=1 Tax=Schaalia suimastitidis TaxID=121163 RepID=UPI000423A339|nr:metal ABC transporter substrate-binding protein [Schaalia suimastitidis]
MKNILRAFAVAATAAFALSACSGAPSHTSSSATDNDKLTIFATTGYLGDAAKNIAPTADIKVMVAPGGDPHTYQPTTQDIEAMNSADLVLWNGLHLEALMIDQLEATAPRGLQVGANVPEKLLLSWPETDDHGNPLHDPHIWNSPEIWQNVVTQIGDRLAQIDPAKAEEYRTNAKTYNQKIADIDERAMKAFKDIPQANRVLVTGHDAFNYLGQRYGLTVHATDFVTSEAELSAADLEELANTIVEAKVPTIFVDNLQNPQAIESLKEAVTSKGWNVTISDKELFADSLGESAPVDTYLGVFEHNIQAITEGLGAR